MDFDKDLAARQEARTLCRQAQAAQKQLSEFSQSQLDKIVESVAKAFSAAAVELAELAVRETGFGNREDKVTKNRFASDRVAATIRSQTCVGLLREDPQARI